MSWNVIMKSGDTETVLMELPTVTEAYSLVRKMETAGLKEGVSLMWRKKEDEAPQEEKKQEAEKNPSKEHSVSLIKPSKEYNVPLINARRAKECKNYSDARHYYNMVKMREPENWEATFYSTYCGVRNIDISDAVRFISNCIKMVLKDIKKLKNTAEQNKAIKQISTDLFDYVSYSQIEVMNSYDKHRDKVMAKLSFTGLALGTDSKK